MTNEQKFNRDNCGRCVHRDVCQKTGECTHFLDASLTVTLPAEFGKTVYAVKRIKCADCPHNQGKSVFCFSECPVRIVKKKFSYCDMRKLGSIYGSYSAAKEAIGNA